MMSTSAPKHSSSHPPRNKLNQQKQVREFIEIWLEKINPPIYWVICLQQTTNYQLVSFLEAFKTWKYNYVLSMALAL